jgi:uncharacterized HAD superfamily protein
MCQSKAQGGLRCSNSAKAVLDDAIASGDEKAIKGAKIEYLTSPAGIQSLREQGKAELADKFARRREILMQQNQRQWRKENGISVALDIDNTTADFTGAFRASLATKYGLTKEEALERYPEPADYDMSTWFKGGRDEFYKEFREAEARGGLYSNMKIFSKARKEITGLHNDGYTIHFVTARIPEFNAETKLALRKYRLPYHLLKHTEEKHEHDAHIFVDDAPKQISTLTVHGKKVVAYHNLYNAHQREGVARVQEWNGMSEVIHEHTSPKDEKVSHF